MSHLPCSTQGTYLDIKARSWYGALMAQVLHALGDFVETASLA